MTWNGIPLVSVVGENFCILGVTVCKKTKAATGGVLKKNVFLKILQYSQENTCVGVEKFYLKETAAQVFSREYCEVFKNICFEEHVRKAASEKNINI